jgi:hypothetical protein
MWAAIRSDLSEFVSGVADETDQVIQQTMVSDEGEVLGEGFEDTGVIHSPEDEVARLQNHVETYSEPLDEADEDVQEFLDKFDIEQKTLEITKLLEDHPDTIKGHFEALVPTEISYELFWQRYFYRCDEDRISTEWQNQEEQNRQARANAIAGGIQSVTNLFGGAMAAVSKAVTIEDAGETPVSPFANFGSSQPMEKSAAPGAGGVNLFGSGGRPPFVMNTAVDEDDEEEEEEELGWDDDDDDEEEEEEESVSEEIAFSGGNNQAIQAMDKLSEQLAQALSERDALKETIALQSKEIVNLKESKAPTDSTNELEKLKLSMFEKDAELAALKASLEDTDEDDKQEHSKKDAVKIAALERDVERLTSVVSEKDAQLATCNANIEEVQADMVRTREAAASGHEVLQSSLDLTKAEADSLRQVLESMSQGNEELETAKQEVMMVQSKMMALDIELEETQKHLTDAKTQSADLEQEMDNLKDKLVEMEETQKDLTDAKKQSADLEQEMEKLKEKLVQMEAKPVTPPASVTEPVEEDRASPNSVSSGVKVDPARPVRGSDQEGEESDWGDDWGEEEE